ncbi:MAG: zf-HC2 domain-containing protein [Myxococcales bacterium]|nr:zf-HC2 domain-containing protein [Myxococcales bacterium]MCB9532657.1 zf-HC2 domain-containing protein [Myxococcales bacterium]
MTTATLECSSFVELVDLYVDGALDPSDAAEIEAHASVCPHCDGALARRLDTRGQLQALAGASACDAALLARLGGALDKQTRRRAVEDVPRYAAAAAVALLFVGVGGVGGAAMRWAAAGVSSVANAETAAMMTASIQDPLVDELVRWHLRQIPVEVTGPDSETVGEWFEGKVDFPVAPPDFDRSAHLLGGRLGHVEDADAAMLVYDAGGAKLSVIVFDPAGRQLPTAHTPDGREVPFFVARRSGYSIAVHQRGGIAYAFASELPDDRLEALVESALRHGLPGAAVPAH